MSGSQTDVKPCRSLYKMKVIAQSLVSENHDAALLQYAQEECTWRKSLIGMSDRENPGNY